MTDRSPRTDLGILQGSESLFHAPRLFRPGGTVAKRRRFWLVDSAGVPSRRVRLNREEMAYLNAHGCLPNRGITGIRGTINV